jgi:hypothetical protein
LTGLIITGDRRSAVDRLVCGGLIERAQSLGFTHASPRASRSAPMETLPGLARRTYPAAHR